MLKKIMLILISTLFIFSCDIIVEPEESVPEYVGTWVYIIEDTSYTTTSRRLVIGEDSYSLYLDTLTKITDSTNSIEQERGSVVGDEVLDSLSLTTTHVLNGTTLEYVTTLYQESRTVYYSLAGSEITIADGTTSANLTNITATYTKR